MNDRIFYYKITPEVVKNKLFKFPYTGNGETFTSEYEVCCDIFTSAVTKHYTGETYVYSSMTQILSGGTNGTSLLTDLSIPIFLTETTTDIGYYSVFDGLVLQKDVMTNFLFESSTIKPREYSFYNTSDLEFKKYLSFSEYKVDWGDGSPITTISHTTPKYTHVYNKTGQFTITMSGMSPWGVNLVKKDVTVPFTKSVISNPKGTAFFIPSGGSWLNTPISYDYIFSGDSICDVDVQSSGNFTKIPILVTGYTKSNINDLVQYGKKSKLYDGKFKLGERIKLSEDTFGKFIGPSKDGLYVSYEINEVLYHDYIDGTTIFMVESSGLTSDMMICSAITKNEVLLNVIDEAEVQSDIFIERGKQSGLESMIRLGEVDNVGDLLNYGYGFFNVVEIG